MVWHCSVLWRLRAVFPTAGIRWLVLLLAAGPAFGQGQWARVVAAEAAAGHFSGTALVAQGGRVVWQGHQGMANRQFAVPMTDTTRLPIASMTKLLTAILTLQLLEKGQLRLDAAVADYVPDLPAASRTVTIRQLLTHHSGLKNEPVAAYQSSYSTSEFISRFVAIREGATVTFNYNNVDYIVLTRLLEVVSKQPYAKLVRRAIFDPAGMAHSGVLAEEQVVPGLAYGYHNYSFGDSTARRPLRNDSPTYLSNYAGAGAIYSTAGDLLRLVEALRQHKLLSAASTVLLTRPQQPGSFVPYARGYPTLGFYYNDKALERPVLERRGSINGFNSALLTDPTFSRVVILLANTDTGDLELIGDELYGEFR
jgi:teichoic acid D-alanine hydrolase